MAAIGGWNPNRYGKPALGSTAGGGRRPAGGAMGGGAIVPALGNTMGVSSPRPIGWNPNRYGMGIGSHMPKGASLTPAGDIGERRQREAVAVNGFKDGETVRASAVFNTFRGDT